MARLQDFQSVTPSAANDNLLIVQAAGQGLSRINAVGDAIFNARSANDLALGTGTPPSGSTAEAIANRYTKAEIDAVSEQELNISSFSTYKIKLVKYGKIVTMRLPPINSLTSGGAVTIYTGIPSIYIPRDDFIEEFLDAAQRRMRINVTTGGNITLRVYGQDITASNLTYKNFVWITD